PSLRSSLIMVWVNPPNRVNYTVIMRVRNVHSRNLSEFDAAHLQNVQPPATVNVAEKSNSQAPIIREIRSEKTQHPNPRIPCWRIGDSLEFGFWILPTNRKFREAGLLA